MAADHHDLSEVCQAQASLGASWQTEQHYYFFFTIYFFNKKVDLSSLRGGGCGRTHRIPPSLRV